MKKRLDVVLRFLARRQTAYRKVFDGPWADVVLVDLARFCRAHESTFHPDARVAAQLDGRREVLLRIQHHLGLTPDELFELTTGEARNQQIIDNIDDR